MHRHARVTCGGCAGPGWSGDQAIHTAHVTTSSGTLALVTRRKCRMRRPPGGRDGPCGGAPPRARTRILGRHQAAGLVHAVHGLALLEAEVGRLGVAALLQHHHLRRARARVRQQPSPAPPPRPPRAPATASAQPCAAPAAALTARYSHPSGGPGSWKGRGHAGRAPAHVPRAQARRPAGAGCGRMLRPHRRPLRALAPRARRRTRIPACASSAAATPPPAPEPTTTASQSMVTLSSSVCARMRSEGRPGPGSSSARAGPGRRRGRRCVAARRCPAGPPGLRIRAVSAPRRWRSGHRRATLCISCIDRLRVGPARAWVACSRGGRGRASTTRRPCANSMAASCPVLRQTAVAMSSVAPSSAASLASLAALGCAGRAGSAPARSPGVMPVAWADSELLPSTLG